MVKISGTRAFFAISNSNAEVFLMKLQGILNVKNFEYLKFLRITMF